jgi:hypothetical protein
MHDRLVNEVTMGTNFARFIACASASADAFRRLLLGVSSSSVPLRVIRG